MTTESRNETREDFINRQMGPGSFYEKNGRMKGKEEMTPEEVQEYLGEIWDMSQKINTDKLTHLPASELGKAPTESGKAQDSAIQAKIMTQKKYDAIKAQPIGFDFHQFKAKFKPGDVVKFVIADEQTWPIKGIVTHVIFDKRGPEYIVAWFVHSARHSATTQEIELELWTKEDD